jgi:hypothetical protein
MPEEFITRISEIEAIQAAISKHVDTIKVINDHDNFGSQTFPMDGKNFCTETWSIDINGRAKIMTDKGRTELTTGKRGIQSKTVDVKPDSTIQSFEKIIMECHDMLSIDEKVESMYADWTRKGKKKTKLGFYVFRCISLLIGGFGFGYNIMMASEAKGIAAWIFLGFAAVLLVLEIMLIDKTDFKEAIDTFIKFLNRTFINRKNLEEKPSGHSRFQFLKETYQKTIDDLNSRLTTVLVAINDQINSRKADITEIESNKDIFGNSDEVIHEIERDIVHLETRREKVKQKQESIKQTMEEYLGKQGYIAQKEQEIERLKKAQELTDRIKENHKVTLEITKQVDVLTDVIIPGIKRLMEFKIPELINEVEYGHDRETALLEIKG